MQTATLRLLDFECTGTKALGGFDDATGEWVFILRKVDDATYRLHYGTIGSAELALRGIVDATQSEANELNAAMIATLPMKKSVAANQRKDDNSQLDPLRKKSWPTNHSTPCP